MLGNLLNGLRIALLLPVREAGFRFSWGAFWFVVSISLLCSFVLGFGLTAPPLAFQPQALLTKAFVLMALLLSGFLSALLFRDQSLQLRVPILFLNAAFWVQIISYLWLGLLTSAPEGSMHWSAFGYYATVVWYLLISIRSIALLTAALPLRRLLAGSLLTGLLVLPEWFIAMPRFWETDYYQLYQEQEAQQPEQPELNAEYLLTHQWPTLQSSWTELNASSPGKVDLFFVGFAGHGEQDVFMKEIQYSKNLFDSKFGTRGRSLALINNPSTADLVPLATASNLRASLRQLDPLIQEEDILFLFLTSHGSKDHYLSVNLPPLPLNDLDANQLGIMLSESRFRWKIILVSACYSGGFIEHLKSPNTLVMTAARADRTSFGCSDDAEFTYFGRAYFAEALQQTDDFIDAFDIAKNLVHEWETKEKFTPSEPQIFIGEAIREKLGQQDQLLIGKGIQ